MGVDVTTYLFFGVKFNLKEVREVVPDLYEKLEIYIDGAPEAGNKRAIYDGMGGQTLHMGYVLGSFDQYGEGEEVTIDPAKFTQIVRRDYEWIKDIIPESCFHSGLELFFFNHYS